MIEAAARPRSQTAWTAVGLALVPFIGLGLGRFAYALLLPSMQANLQFSNTVAGLLNAANALGYLLGAVSGGAVARRWGERTAIAIGLVACILPMGLTGAVSTVPLVFLLRCLSGVGTAVAFVGAAGLAGRLPPDTLRRYGGPLALYAAGAGAGVAVSAGIAPLVLEGGGGGWRVGWVVLGVFALLLTPGALLAARAVPRRAARTPSAPTTGTPVPGPGEIRSPRRTLAPVLAAYALFGFGYVAYMTFVVSLWHRQRLGEGTITALWFLLGIAACLAPLAWAPVSRRVTGARLPATALFVVALGAALPLAGSTVIDIGSALLFGASFLAVVTQVTIVARRTLPAPALTAGIAILTAAFGAGQVLGPIAAGAVSDGGNGVARGLAMSAIALLAAALIALVRLPDRPRDA
ncbi:MAG: YbfB/YjiJ family MFS transporter [Candidatus Dormiibacterota bacterium]